MFDESLEEKYQFTRKLIKGLYTATYKELGRAQWRLKNTSIEAFIPQHATGTIKLHRQSGQTTALVELANNISAQGKVVVVVVSKEAYRKVLLNKGLILEGRKTVLTTLKGLEHLKTWKDRDGFIVVPDLVLIDNYSYLSNRWNKPKVLDTLKEWFMKGEEGAVFRSPVVVPKYKTVIIGIG